MEYLDKFVVMFINDILVYSMGRETGVWSDHGEKETSQAQNNIMISYLFQNFQMT
jgi:hypothetical protein